MKVKDYLMQRFNVDVCNPTNEDSYSVKNSMGVSKEVFEKSLDDLSDEEKHNLMYPLFMKPINKGGRPVFYYDIVKEWDKEVSEFLASVKCSECNDISQ